ncbi:MAG TPA: cytochrome c biogenesis protein ResB [Planctomycetota bacterium]|jgi:hypothetical protein
MSGNAVAAPLQVQPERKSLTWPLLANVPAIASLIAALMIIQRGCENEWTPDLYVLLGLIGAASAYFLWKARANLWKAVSSVSMAAVLLLAIAGATAIGTFIPQNEVPQVLEQRYGEAGAEWIDRLSFVDVFGSFWFTGLMSLLAVSLLIVILRRKFWRAPQWGFVLSHGGMILLLGGAVAGNVFGQRGMLNLKKGKPAERVEGRERSGARTGSFDLGFAVTLEAFDIEKYPDEYRLYVYTQKQGAHKPALERSLKAQQATSWTKVAGGKTRFRVSEYYPEIDLREVWTESKDASASSAARVQLDGNERWLAAGADPVTVGAAQVEFANEANSANWIERTSKPAPPKHFIDGEGGPMEVKIGETYTVPGTPRKFKVTEFLRDFSWDVEAKRAVSRTEEYKNPALCVEELAEGAKPVWLFMNMPGHGRKPTDLDLKYRCVFSTAPIAHLIRIDAQAKDIAYASGGKEVLRRPFELGRAEAIALTGKDALTLKLAVSEVLAHGSPSQVARNLSKEPKNPGVKLEIAAEDGATREKYLVGKEGAMYELAPGVKLIFEPKEGGVKSYRSHVAISRDNQVVGRATIMVNDPLTCGGYTFYQSSYDRSSQNVSEPDISGLKVIRDPGLGTVYIGMIMISLGVAFIYYVRPRLLRGSAGVRAGGDRTEEVPA